MTTLSSSVGTTGFEPATPCTPCKCATGLRYVPNFVCSYRKQNGVKIYIRKELINNHCPCDPPAPSGMRYRAALRPELCLLISKTERGKNLYTKRTNQ